MSKPAKPPKIQFTQNYKQFKVDPANRPLDLRKHAALKRNMQENGFIPNCAIICYRDNRGQLWVKDGQHRLAFAEALGLTVYFTETDLDFDIAALNNTQRSWAPIDYAKRFADAGSAEYAELLAFKEEHGLPLCLAAALLGGTAAFANLADRFYAGEFVVTDREWAKAVVGVYGPLTGINKELKTRVFLIACMAAARVKGFSAKRLLDGRRRWRHKLSLYANRDEYLGLLEEFYNAGQSPKNKFALKIEAQKVMRERNPRHRKAGGESDAA